MTDGRPAPGQPYPDGRPAAERRVPSGLVVLTDRHQARRPLPEVVAGAVAGGVRWVILREKDLPRPERVALAAQLRPILSAVGGTLIMAGPDPLGGTAVHLAAADPGPSGGGTSLIGRSCHNRAELARLTTEDYATLSPVYLTSSKPGYGPPFGPDNLAGLIRDSPVPVLALGGIGSPQQVAGCLAAGAAGVAVLGAVMRADDPAEAAATLLAQAVPPDAGHARPGADPAVRTSPPLGWALPRPRWDQACPPVVGVVGRNPSRRTRPAGRTSTPPNQPTPGPASHRTNPPPGPAHQRTSSRPGSAHQRGDR